MKQLIPVEQKMVNFDNAEILGVKANDGKVYVGVRWVCEGIGLTDDQTKNERKKIQSDVVLKQGGLNLTLPTNGGNQEVLVIELDFLPLWLAKISITPNMQENQPDVAKKLIQYQLKAKNILAEAFLHNKPSYMVDDPIERAERWIEEQKNKRIAETKVLMLEQQVAEYEPRISYLDQILKSKKTLTTSQIAADYDLTAQALNKFLQEKRVQRKVNGQWLLYHEHMGNGYTKSETIPIVRSNGDSDVTLSTRWTQKGRLFIHQILEGFNIVPLVDRQ